MSLLAFFNLTAVSFLVLFSTQAYGTDSRNLFEQSAGSIGMAMLLDENTQANPSVPDNQETYAETFNDSDNPTFDSLLKNLEIIGSGKFSIRNFEISRKELKDVRKQLRQNPNDIKAHVKLGIVYRKLGKDQEAIASYKEAIRIEPDFFNAHLNLGSTYLDANQYQEAIVSYKEVTRIKPDVTDAHNNLGIAYTKLGQHKEAIVSFKEAIRLKPDYADAHNHLGNIHLGLGQYLTAIASYREVIRIKPGFAMAYNNLGWAYKKLTQYQDAISSFKESIRLKPNDAVAHHNLGTVYNDLGKYKEAIAEYKEALRVVPNYTLARNNLDELERKLINEKLAREKLIAEKKKIEREARLSKQKKLEREARLKEEEAEELAREREKIKDERKRREELRDRVKRFAERKKQAEERLAHEERLIKEERKKLEALRLTEKKPPPHKEQIPQSGSGSGFFVSKMGHVITNAHVVQNCKKITIGDNANKQVPAELINTDRSSDLALLKLSTLEMASAESKSLIQKLGIVVVPLATNGLLRNEDVRLGEKVLVAGYPFGDVFSNTIKVTSGIVSAIRGAGDDSGQFQLDAAVQPGNSGGPIYDSSGNIVGVVISQLDKLKMAKAIGSLPENVNFGIKASTVRQFLTSSGLPSKKSERTEEKSTEQLAEIAKNQALMVMCLQ